MQAAAVK